MFFTRLESLGFTLLEISSVYGALPTVAT